MTRPTIRAQGPGKQHSGPRRDHPWNVDFDYLGEYRDRLPEAEYADLLRATLRTPSIVIHRPEVMFKVAGVLGQAPERVVSWTHHTNLPPGFALIGWFEATPDFSRVRRPYRNPTDSRVSDLLAAGSKGASIGDWWHIERVTHQSAEQTGHPCQTPVEVFSRLIGVTEGELVVDPFAGAGTSLVAARRLGRHAIGIEQSAAFCEIARMRLEAEARAPIIVTDQVP